MKTSLTTWGGLFKRFLLALRVRWRRFPVCEGCGDPMRHTVDWFDDYAIGGTLRCQNCGHAEHWSGTA